MIRQLWCALLIGFALSGVPIAAGGQITSTATSQNEANPKSYEKPVGNDAKTFFESPLGVQIAWYASIVGVVLGLIPLGLYFQERNKSKLLNSVLEKYDLATRVESEAEKANRNKIGTEEALQKSKEELADLTKQLEQSIPGQARAAFFRAALPEIDRQISYLQEQRESMEKGLSETGVPLNDSSRLKPILQKEINQTVMARQLLDEKQTVLSILAGLAAGTSGLSMFEVFIFPLRIVLGCFILWSVYDLGMQWATVYPERKLSKLLDDWGRWLPFMVLGAVVVSALLLLLIVFLIQGPRF
jgi:hypothetical protein